MMCALIVNITCQSVGNKIERIPSGDVVHSSLMIALACKSKRRHTLLWELT